MATHNTIPKFLGNEKNTIQELLRRIDKLECCLKELEATVAAGGGGAGDAGDGQAVGAWQDAFFSATAYTVGAGYPQGILPVSGSDVNIDFSALPGAAKVRFMTSFGTDSGTPVLSVANADVLVNLEDLGTQYAVVLPNSMAASVIDDFFTQLPATTKTATINASPASGAGACDPTIATSKGYTVIT